MKNVLLFMVDFYQYKNMIIDELKNQSYSVKWYSDEVQLNVFEKIISKIVPFYKQNKFDKYFHNIIKTNQNFKFDIIIIIFGAKFFQKKHINMLKSFFPNTKIIYYAWDSVKNFKRIENLFLSCDICYSFDKYDSEKYHVNFLPLFCPNNKVDFYQEEIKYDVVTMMSFYIEKYRHFKNCIMNLPPDLKTRFILKLPNKAYYYRIKFLHPFIFKFTKKYYVFSSINYCDVIRLILSSKAVIDCPLPNQKGLTMRTFETLFLRRKLITCNPEIKKYDFFSNNNIFVIGDKDKTIPSCFFDEPFSDCETSLNSYKLSVFIKTLTRL